MFNAVSTKKYDLEERTQKFGEDIIIFCRELPKDEVITVIVRQLIRSGTSVGANYCEADCAESRKDFVHKLGICNKEVKETKHWLRMVGVSHPQIVEKARLLWKEAHELNLIFISIIRKTKENDDKKEEER